MKRSLRQISDKHDYVRLYGRGTYRIALPHTGKRSIRVASTVNTNNAGNAANEHARQGCVALGARDQCVRKKLVRRSGAVWGMNLRAANGEEGGEPRDAL